MIMYGGKTKMVKKAMEKMEKGMYDYKKKCDEKKKPKKGKK